MFGPAVLRGASGARVLGQGFTAPASPRHFAKIARDLMTPKIACIDVETTGLHPSTDRIVELAIVNLDEHGDLETSWSTRINPERDPGPTFAHGLTADMLADAPLFAAVAAELARHIEGRVLAAHNVNFDYNFIRYEFDRAGLETPTTPTLCTIRAAWAVGRRQRGGSRKLADLCLNEGIQYDDEHTALGDALATADLVRAYVALAQQQGLTLADLVDGPTSER